MITMISPTPSISTGPAVTVLTGCGDTLVRTTTGWSVSSSTGTLTMCSATARVSAALIMTVVPSHSPDLRGLLINGVMFPSDQNCCNAMTPLPTFLLFIFCNELCHHYLLFVNFKLRIVFCCQHLFNSRHTYILSFSSIFYNDWIFHTYFHKWTVIKS